MSDPGADRDAESEHAGHSGDREGTRGDDSTDERGDTVVSRLSPEEAFSLLGHETRLRTLETLSAADGPLAFSELRERVGADDPGGFNYHLGKLVGRYVRKVDGAAESGTRASLTAAPDTVEGYELTMPGRRMVGAVLSGGTTKGLDGDADPVPVDADCPNCGAAMRAQFRDHGVRVGCDDCPFDFTNPEIPPGALEGRPHEAVPELVDRWLKRGSAVAEHGFCEVCDGPFERRFLVSTDDDAPDWLTGEAGAEVTVRDRCARCGYGWHSSVAAAVTDHPAVVAFHWEHGVDLRETPRWELP
ncbi:winged helix-turn-helix domain-containing protein [Halobium salinum]|uniref:Winged helix-turn-helix domain-containing protein n=1 Tax=Halobium salinum TaxID=1364940 RepID=A0ABD5P8L6_9EURY|nr:helix-turn-helix domain-containing protein [Halobium salinum]